jgi:hypothetical protein
MSADSLFVRIAGWLGWTPYEPLRVTPQFAIPDHTLVVTPVPEIPLLVPSPRPGFAPPEVLPPAQSGEEALSELYDATLAYKSSKAYRELLDYIARFRNYSSYNLFLVRIQKPDARYVATVKHWKLAFDRRPKPDARALIMLQPGGPVRFVYDLTDTAPAELLDPFHAEGQVPEFVWKTVLKNCRREGFTVVEKELPATQAGFVRGSIDEHSEPPYFDITLNANNTEPARFVTLAHELAHVYCGHLGGHPWKLWPDRSDLTLDTREFEAESAAYIVTKRRGIESGSERHLSEYLDTHPEVTRVDVELVIKVADRIEKMKYALRPLRKNQSEEETD